MGRGSGRAARDAGGRLRCLQSWRVARHRHQPAGRSGRTAGAWSARRRAVPVLLLPVRVASPMGIRILSVLPVPGDRLLVAAGPRVLLPVAPLALPPRRACEARAASQLMPTVLVVDDERQIAEIARDYLQHAGFTVLVARDGQEALAAARRQRPDLVVVDLGLPGLDGLDVAATLRRDSNVPIIMLTARVDESDRIRGLEVGADDYVTKPFSPRELVARVRAVLRRSDERHRPDQSFRFGVLTVDPTRMAGTRGREEV